MDSQTVASIYNRYKILQPHSQILFLRNNLSHLNKQSYSIIKVLDRSVRLYHQYCDNIDGFLPTAQWRFLACSEIAHYFHIKINKPNVNDRGVEYELYIQHMELLLKDTNRLITSQSLYFLVKCLKGYSQLLMKFKKVSINPQTIGLNSSGHCIIWLNRYLQRNYPEYYAVSDELQIIKSVIGLLKEKGQITCQSILVKIEQYAIKQRSSIKELLGYISNMIHLNGIKMPTNLKYLLKQKRIISELEELQGEKNKMFQKYRESAQPFRQSNFTSKYAMPASSQMLHVQPQSSEFEKRILKLKSDVKRTSNIQSRMISSRTQQKNQPLIRINSECRGTKQLSSFCSMQWLNSKESLSKSKSKSPHEHSSVTKLKYPYIYRSAQKGNLYYSKCYMPLALTKISQAQTASSLIEIDKLTASKSPLNPSTNQKFIHNSILSQISINVIEKIVPQEEQQSYESSPDKGQLLNILSAQKQEDDKSLDDSFEMKELKTDNKDDLIFKRNNWTKTVEGLLQLDEELNTSFVEGSQKNIYLADIELEKLDVLNRNLAQSLMPQNIFPSLELTLPSQK